MIIKQEDMIGLVFELHEMESLQFKFSFVVLTKKNFQPITILDSIPLWFLIYMRNVLMCWLDGIFSKLVAVSTVRMLCKCIVRRKASNLPNILRINSITKSAVLFVYLTFRPSVSSIQSNPMANRCVNQRLRMILEHVLKLGYVSTTILQD
uniref:Uncharacterized protein n=1 Tax=Glossina pallidipes TaxID=7398 RepID=A0A1A9ZJA7_GLOPL